MTFVFAMQLDAKVNYPIIVDSSREIKQHNLSFLFPATTEGNMEEVLRVIDSLQKASKFMVTTPTNWKSGAQLPLQKSNPIIVIFTIYVHKCFF